MRLRRGNYDGGCDLERSNWFDLGILFRMVGGGRSSEELLTFFRLSLYRRRVLCNIRSIIARIILI